LTYFNSDDQPAQSRRHSQRRRRIGTFLLLVFVLGLGSMFVLPSGFVVEQPGPVFNVLSKVKGASVITISGAKTYPTAGSLDLLTVNVQGSPTDPLTLAQVFSLATRRGSKIVPTDEVYPPDLSATQVEKVDQQMMQDSQEAAKVIALEYLGYKVPYKVGVVEIQADSPANHQLKLDDKILRANGKAIRKIDDLPNLVAAWSKSKPIAFKILRSGKLEDISVTPQKRADGTWRLGIVIAPAYEFPFEVTTKLADVGGPSGGLMFTLGIIDRLTKGYLNGGKQVAGTGTIDLDGNVGPIGGVEQKMIGASEKGAQYFLAPQDDCAEVLGHVPVGLEVFAVANLKDALKVLDTIAQGASLETLPTCGN